MFKASGALPRIWIVLVSTLLGLAQGATAQEEGKSVLELPKVEEEASREVSAEAQASSGESRAYSRGEGDMSLGTWGMSYFNFTSGEVEYVNRGGGSWNIYQYVSLNRKLSPSSKFSVRPAFNSQTAGVYDNYGNTRPMKTELSDFHVSYADYELASFPGDWELSGMFYAYLPTSESSQAKKWALRLRSWMILEKPLNRYWSIGYNAKPEYFFNTQRAYRNEKTNLSPDGREFKSVRADNNKLAKLDHYVQISRYVNRTITPQLDLGFTHEWYETSAEADSRALVSDKFKIAPNAEIQVNRQLRFIVGLENSIDVRDRRGKPFKLFQEEDNQYYLMTFWTIL